MKSSARFVFTTLASLAITSCSGSGFSGKTPQQRGALTAANSGSETQNQGDPENGRDPKTEGIDTSANGQTGNNPGSSNRDSSNPDSSNPDSSNPDSSNPGSSNPGSSNPGSSNPGSSNPGSSNPDASTDDSTNTGTTTSPAVAYAKCSDAALVKTASVSVRITKNEGEVCPWGVGDNGDKSDGKTQARIEKKFPISIPSGRVVCAVSAKTTSSTIRYDDSMFLALNNFVLLGSSDAVNLLFSSGSNGFPVYEWSKIKGTSRDNNGDQCAAGVTCSLPKTQKSGEISFQISPSKSEQLFKSLAGQPLEFKLILTGDNNSPVDCQLYNSFDIAVNYTYVSN
jgi:hypothetical protein